MSEKKIDKRRKLIGEMLADESQIKNFYRFAAQNPHINLHDGYQIVLARPTATVCYSFEEWNAMERRVKRGRQGIPYYNLDDNKCFVFDATDTHGESYQRLFLPMKHLLQGLDELNGTSLADDGQSDYRKIHRGVAQYLRENSFFTGNSEYDGLLVEGIAYSLYCKTGFPKDYGITLHGLPYSLTDNAELFKEIYITTSVVEQEIEDAYQRKRTEVKVIEDIEDETVSDEVFAERKVHEEHEELNTSENPLIEAQNVKGKTKKIKTADKSENQR